VITSPPMRSDCSAVTSASVAVGEQRDVAHAEVLAQRLLELRVEGAALVSTRESQICRR
jgi:hypothetical protein